MESLQQTTVSTNIDWFKDNDQYMENQARLECYQNIQLVVEHELRGVGELLDVGNGGHCYTSPGPAHRKRRERFTTQRFL